MTTKLPKSFESLQEYVPDWALDTEHDRREKRATSSMQELQAYYDVVGTLVPEIARHLDEYPIDESLPDPQLKLFRLGQMYMEVAWAVEFVGEPEEADQVPRHRWEITNIRQTQPD